MSIIWKKAREARYDARRIGQGEADRTPDSHEGEEAVHPISEVHFGASTAKGVRWDVHFRIRQHLEVVDVSPGTGVMQRPERR